MHRPDQPQPGWVHRPAVLGGDIVGNLPVGRQRVIAERVGRRDADHAQAILAGHASAGWGYRADHRDLGVRIGVGQDVRPGADQRVPIGLFRNPLAFEQPQDDIQRLGHPVALRVRVDAQPQRVGCQQAGAGAEHYPAAGVMVQLDDPVRGHQRIMIRQ